MINQWIVALGRTALLSGLYLLPQRFANQRRTAP
jgi:hypothetical protein